MKVILFGATGMVGQGVLRECLLDDAVTEVLAVGRTAVATEHPKLRQLVGPDPTDLSTVDDLAAYDACLFCLGISSVGLSEAEYRRITYDMTLSVARTLAATSPEVAFVYVSGAGTDTHGRAMWARVKGATEDDLMALLPNAYMVRPGIIQPLHGIRSKTRLYRTLYTVAVPLLFVLKRLSRSLVITTEQVGRAMVRIARSGYPKRVLENRDIAEAATPGT